MRSSLAPFLLAAMALTTAAWGQAPGAQGPAMQVFRDADLHLTFSFPADLQPTDAKSMPGASTNSRFGADSEESMDAGQPGACGKVLLSVGKTTKGSHGTIWGTLSMLDIQPSCIPPKALKSKRAMDSLLRPLVSGGTQVLGMMPLGTETVYLIQGHKVHMVAAQGQPVAKTDLQPAEQMQTVAHIAVAVDDHILLWKVESNNPGLLNRMLASQLDLGIGSPAPLFPGRLQNDLQF